VNKLFRVEALLCEGLQNPYGVDETSPRLSWEMHSECHGVTQSAYQVICATRPSLLNETEADLWNSEKILSSESQGIVYEGQPLVQSKISYWAVRIWDQDGVVSSWSEKSSWSFFGMQRDRDWSAEWIKGESSSPWLRQTFELKEIPESAFAYINSLGYFQLHINGRKVSDDEFVPHVGQYDKKTFCMTYEISDHLHVGVNSVGLWLGSGWNKAGAGLEIDPCIRAQFETLVGAVNQVCLKTEGSWRAKVSSHSYLGKWCWNQFGGEEHRGDLDLPNWSGREFDDSAWDRVSLVESSDHPVKAPMLQSSRCIETLEPVSLTQLDSGDWLVDMGKAMTGTCEIALPAQPKGHRISLEFGDHFKETPDGRSVELNHFNQISEYVFRGEGDEVFRNVFNYASFRYILVRSLVHGELIRSKIKGYLISTDLAASSSFKCSNDTLNEIHHMMEHTLKCLMLGGYQVDCHSRERYGYGGDGQSSLDTTLAMFRADSLYRKWTADWLDGQGEKGELTYTSPASQHGGGPFWCGFLPAVTLKHYLNYGDLNLVRRNYPGIKKWLELAQNHTVQGLQEKFCGGWYLGDWASPEAISDEDNAEVFIQCYMVYVLKQAAQLADYMEEETDGKRFSSWAEERAKATHQEFYDPKGRKYGSGDQVTYILPLISGVCPKELEAELLAGFEKVFFERDGGHLSTGLSGTYLMVQYLQSIDRHDLIYAFASKRTYPSWGYMLENGATATWEHWEGIRSRIHNCYNNIGSWFIQGLAGIQPDALEPGFKSVVIKPSFLNELDFVEGSHRTIYGLIESRWRRVASDLELEIKIPANTRAVVHLPLTSIGKIEVNRASLKDADGLKVLDSAHGCLRVQTMSGRYRFRIKK
jgi:alpha-L-rhamnosidase